MPISGPATQPVDGAAILARDGGATIAYRRVAGAAPGIVFLGGFRSDMTGTKALFLEDYCRKRGRAYVRFDYFAHGRSSGDFADGTISRWRDDAVVVIDSLTDGPQILIGSSMGGWIMVLAALARPARVAALVGVAAAPDFTTDLLPRRLSEAQQRRLFEDGQIVLPSPYDPAGYLYTRVLVEDGDRHLVLRGDIPLACRVRLLHGMADESVPWQQSLSLAERLSGDDVTLTLVKDGDHRLSRDEDLARLAGVLDELTGAQRP
ncbi:MAG TPA: alpha/beta hydrolase [Stellaceae bacterium]|nr:alpha/beta hydrolase [Stellaceae bacterium]